jgi:type IV fimbrial biogenesis protein FimT
MHLNPRKNDRGFTLIELMLALAVAAVLASLAAPAMSEFMARQRIDAAAHDITAHINLARLQAVTHAERVVLCPSADGAECTGMNRWDVGWIVFRDGDGNHRPDRESDLLRVGAALERLEVDSAGRIRIRYQPDGTAGGSNLTIKLCDPERPEIARAVIVSNPGRPRVADLPGHLSCPAPG